MQAHAIDGHEPALWRIVAFGLRRPAVDQHRGSCQGQCSHAQADCFAALPGAIRAVGAQAFVKAHALPSQRRSDFSQGGFLRVAHGDAAKSQKTAFFGSLGDFLADVKQPVLVSLRIKRRFRIDDARSLADRGDGSCLELFALRALDPAA